tara:strand:- start:611 stop:1318 length:708 start_codon:yes stop_codon:yes gene_type:complete
MNCEKTGNFGVVNKILLFCHGLLISALLLACDVNVGQTKQVEITEYIIGSEKLYIPNVYTKTKGTSVGKESGFIQTFFPGSTPIPGDPQELWEQGEWHKNINILFRQADPTKAQAVLKGQIDLTKSYENAGSEYELEHRTQTKDEWFRNDIWIEDEEVGSFISCAEKQYEPSNPQCTHYLFSGDYFLKITYSKKFLPDWKLIKTNALALFDSFKSREAATAYVQQFYQQHHIEGD